MARLTPGRKRNELCLKRSHISDHHSLAVAHSEKYSRKGAIGRPIISKHRQAYHRFYNLNQYFQHVKGGHCPSFISAIVRKC